MGVFVSYTKADELLVRTVREDLERLGHSVWMDHQIHGGESWWREIIQEIQRTDVFVFALSDHSQKSKPCQLELRYADQLGIPVLPLRVGPLQSMFIPLGERQMIDYRERSPDAVIQLVVALKELIARPVLLPDPLPEPPDVPFEYLFRIARVMGPDPITPEEQDRLIWQLRSKLKEEDDEVAKADIVKLLKELRDRGELTQQNAREIDEVLGRPAAQGVEEPTDGATRLPPTDHWRGVERTEPGTGGIEPPAPKPAEPRPTPAREPAATATTATTTATTATMPSGGSGTRPRPAPPQPAAPAKERPPEPHPQQPSGTGTATVPGWLADIVRSGGQAGSAKPRETGDPPDPGQSGGPGAAGPRETGRPAGGRPDPRQAAGSPAAIGWWDNPGGPAAPATPPARTGFARAGMLLGALGIPFLVLALIERAGSAALAVFALVATVVGFVASLVAVRRREPAFRPAVVVAAAGLLGAVVYAVAVLTH